MDLLEKSRNTLELPAVLEMLAGEAVSEPAKAEALALVPSVHRAEVERLLAETSDAKDMMVYKGSPSLSGLRDVRGSLARADMGGVLNTRELLEIAGVPAKRARRALLRHERREGDVHRPSFQNAPDESVSGGQDRKLHPRRG